MADTTLEVLISARDQFTPTANRVIGTLGHMQSAARNVAGGLGRIGSGLGRLGFAAATAGALAFTAALKGGLDSLITLDRLGRQTQAVIRSTGGAAGMTADDVRALAEELENLSTIDDKVIQGAENVLLTFPAVGKKAFRPALEAALDLSTALGTDLQGAIIQVGKALQDPERGLTALRRVGVAFTETQQKQIEKLVKQGKLYEAQQIILAELQKEFGGSAGAFGQSTEGRINRVGDAIEDVQKALASGMLPVVERLADRLQKRLSDPKVIAAVEEIGQKIAGLFSDENLNRAERFLGDLVSGTQEFGRTFVNVFNRLPGPVKELAAVLTPLLLALQTPVLGGALKEIIGGAGQVAGALTGTLARGAAAHLPGVGALFAQPVTVVSFGATAQAQLRLGAVPTGATGAAGPLPRGGFLGAVSLLGSVMIAGTSIAALAEQTGVFSGGVQRDQADLQAKADAAANQTAQQSLVHLRAMADTLSGQNVFERLVTQLGAQAPTLSAIEHLAGNLVEDQGLNTAELRQGLGTLAELQQYAIDTFGESVTKQSQIDESIDTLRDRLVSRVTSLSGALSDLADRPAVKLDQTITVNLNGRQVSGAQLIEELYGGRLGGPGSVGAL